MDEGSQSIQKHYRMEFKNLTHEQCILIYRSFCFSSSLALNNQIPDLHVPVNMVSLQ